MTQAVKNERLAVKQKLIDVYTKRAEYFFVEVQEIYPFDHYVKPVRVQAEKPPYFASPRILFNLSTKDMDRCVGMLFYDSEGVIKYPVVEYEAGEQAEELASPFAEELKGNFDEAIKGYEIIAEESTDEIVRDMAKLGKARCLSKLDRLQEAIEIVYELSYTTHFGKIDSSVAAMVMRDSVFLAELYWRANDERLFNHIRSNLENDHWSYSVPVEIIVWQLDNLIAIAEEAGLSEELKGEIESAKGRIEAYENSIEIANIYPNTATIKDWPNETIRRFSSNSKLSGMKFTVADKTILGIYTADKMLNILKLAADDMEDETVGVRLFDNLGNVIGGDGEIEAEPFLTLVPGKYLPDFMVEVYFKSDSVFEDAAVKQTAIYTWTGILVVSLILITGAVATKAMGRQMKLNRLKNDFISTVTHELKTPLSSMRVLVDTLLEGRYEDSTQASEYLQLIAKENVRLTRLIDNFLTFSRMDRNKQIFDLVRIDPADIVTEAVDAVQTRFKQEHCNFTVTVEDNLPPVLADKDAMVTVLVNLLDNAYKYSYENKQIELKVFADNKDVCFMVKDDGIGMTSRQMKKIFDRFYQADSSLSRRVEGSGLGLAIVKYIIEAHNAIISVDSKPENGSRFIVKLPATA